MRRRRFKHLTWNDRLRIETMLKAGWHFQRIANEIGVHLRTIYNEVKRGRYIHTNSDLTTDERYSPDIAEAAYRAHLAEKGPELKIGKDHALAQYIEEKIGKDGYSPAAVLGEIKTLNLKFSTSICETTIYSYIDKGVFLTITNKDLPEKSKKKRGYNRLKKATRATAGTSIEKRPEEINNRKTFGHWEMDCVEGKKKRGKVLLCLTERKSRYEIIIPLANKTSNCVIRALNGIERKYGSSFYRIFRTITVDNGVEFADCEKLEKSCRKSGRRTTLYYCHPYSAYERGTNENLNKMIRRWLPKGTDLCNISAKKIKSIQDWLNNYPREIHGFKSAKFMFESELALIR